MLRSESETPYRFLNQDHFLLLALKTVRGQTWPAVVVLGLYSVSSVMEVLWASVSFGTLSISIFLSGRLAHACLLIEELSKHMPVGLSHSTLDSHGN